MRRKKTLKKQGFSLTDIPARGLKKGMESRLKPSQPDKFFKDPKEVGGALLESLLENDTSAFMEILDAYLRINRTKVAEKSGLSRSTVHMAFSDHGNPTLKTIAKIVHESVTKEN